MEYDMVYGDPHIWNEWYSNNNIGIEGKVSSLYQLDQPRDNKIDDCIRSFHSHHGHTIDDSSIIVTGCGSTQVIIGIVYAMIMHYKKIRLWEQAPHCPLHRDIVNLCGQEWVEHIDTLFRQPHIEFITCPNNPDGSLRKPLSNAHIILWDAVYAWPWYGSSLSKIISHMKKVCIGREYIPIFSFSKSLGLAGERVGYAILDRNIIQSYPNIVEHYRQYIQISTNGICRSGEGVCRVVSSGYKEFPYITEELENRYDMVVDKIRSIIPTIQIHSPRGFPYLWLYRPSHNLYRELCDMGIIGMNGTRFGVTHEYVRLSLLVSNTIIESIASQ